MNDFYAVLGVKTGSSAEDLKRAYRRVARESHPDTHPGDAGAAERFRLAAEAYHVLSDPGRVERYQAAPSHEAFRQSWAARLRNLDPKGIYEEICVVQPLGTAIMSGGQALGAMADAARLGRPDLAAQAGNLVLESAAVAGEALEALENTALGKAAKRGVVGLFEHFTRGRPKKSTAIVKRKP